MASSIACRTSRALSRPRRARELADQHLATYVAFGIWPTLRRAFPTCGRVRTWSAARPSWTCSPTFVRRSCRCGRPRIWTRRCSGTRRSKARAWKGSWRSRSGRPARRAVWAKVRHADTVDAIVAGFSGSAQHPKALAVRLPAGRVALSQRLTRRSHLSSPRAWSPSPGARSGRRLLHARRRGRRPGGGPGGHHPARKEVASSPVQRGSVRGGEGGRMAVQSWQVHADQGGHRLLSDRRGERSGDRIQGVTVRDGRRDARPGTARSSPPPG